MPCVNCYRSRGATIDSKLLRGFGGIKVDFSEGFDIRDSVGGARVHGSFDEVEVEVEVEGMDAMVFVSSTEVEGLMKGLETAGWLGG